MQFMYSSLQTVTEHSNAWKEKEHSIADPPSSLQNITVLWKHSFQSQINQQM